MIDFIKEAAWLCWGAAYIGMGMAALLLSKLAMGFLHPCAVDKELVQSDNLALGVSLSGYYAGVVIVFLGAAVGESANEVMSFGEAAWEAGIDFGYATFGILALNACRKVVEVAILHQFSTVKEILEEHNVGVGAVEAGTMIATALIIAGAIHGQGSFASALVFFVAGMVLLVLFSRFHALLTPYDDQDEIEKDNVAAGAFLGFSMVALGIILLKATKGDFVSWSYNISYFLAYAVVGFLSLAVLQKIVCAMFLPGADIKEEISRDRNLNVAWIAGTLSIGLAAIIFFML